jgi:hypothetical protein
MTGGAGAQMSRKLPAIRRDPVRAAPADRAAHPPENSATRFEGSRAALAPVLEVPPTDLRNDLETGPLAQTRVRPARPVTRRRGSGVHATAHHRDHGVSRRVAVDLHHGEGPVGTRAPRRVMRRRVPAPAGAIASGTPPTRRPVDGGAPREAPRPGHHDRRTNLAAARPTGAGPDREGRPGGLTAIVAPPREEGVVRTSAAPRYGAIVSSVPTGRVGPRTTVAPRVRGGVGSRDPAPSICATRAACSVLRG